MGLFDRYERRAHLAPAITAAIPGLVLLIAGGLSVASSGGVVAVALGAGVVLVCAVVRDRGKALEPDLWVSWGGAPATQRLRWRNTADPVELADLHFHITSVTGIELPDAAAEERDSGVADRAYERAIRRLRSLTYKDDEFGLLKTENMNYGWRRNLLGLRPIGMPAAAIIALASAILWLGGREQRYLVPFVVALVAVVGWYRLNGSWVRPAAERYADQLFAAVETLRRDRPNPTSPAEGAATPAPD